LQEFLKPLEISQHKLAMEIHVPATRIGEIVHGRRAITPETSLRLARYFGTSRVLAEPAADFRPEQGEDRARRKDFAGGAGLPRLKATGKHSARPFFLSLQ
jgi:hypothetical protein